MTRYPCWTLAMWTYVVLTAVLAGCRPTQRGPEGEATNRPVSEQSGMVTVSAEQQAAIELASETVTSRTVQDTITLNGWLVTLPGRETLVRSPVAGYITAGDGGELLPPGSLVSAEQTLGVLQVFLSPQDQAQMIVAKEDADAAVRQSLASLELAQDQLARLEQTPESVVRGTRLLELREIIARSRAAHEEALDKLPFLPQEPYGDVPKLQPLPIHAPINGRIVQVHISPRQLVLQGDPLWALADWSRLWVRVPVYVADLPRLQSGEVIQVTVPGTHTPLTAQRVSWPQPTAPARQTVDLYYVLDNSQAELRPGQAVVASLPLSENVARLTVPNSAVLWDNAGDASVYVRVDAERFGRRRVALGPVIGDRVVVLQGLQEGDVTVTVGAELLYSEEFRWQIPREDEDEDE